MLILSHSDLWTFRIWVQNKIFIFLFSWNFDAPHKCVADRVLFKKFFFYSMQNNNYKILKIMMLQIAFVAIANMKNQKKLSIFGLLFVYAIWKCRWINWKSFKTTSGRPQQLPIYFSMSSFRIKKIILLAFECKMYFLYLYENEMWTLLACLFASMRV